MHVTDLCIYQYFDCDITELTQEYITACKFTITQWFVVKPGNEKYINDIYIFKIL